MLLLEAPPWPPVAVWGPTVTGPVVEDEDVGPTVTGPVVAADCEGPVVADTGPVEALPPLATAAAAASDWELAVFLSVLTLIFLELWP